MPVSVTLRSVKGTALNHTEMDNNFSAIKSALDLASNETLTITSNATLAELNTILVNAAGGSITLTLPAAASNLDKRYTIKRIDSALGNTVTIDGNASETIDGALTASLSTQYQVIRIVCDGSNWYII